MAQSVDIETRIKIFVSYSRADKAFASDLVLGLAACGFAPYIDRQDIAAGEDWEKRLAGLISEADSIVYVISPDSLKSENCAEEFRQALALRKRILPVVWRPVDDAAAPAEMKRLNYILFTGEGRTFAAGLADLAAAVRTDIDWIREHTRLAELSRRWSARSRAPALLLRGDDIDAARNWMTDKPISAAAVTDEQADFIKASADARTEAEHKAMAARRGLLTAVSAVAVVFAGLAAVAAWQWQSASKAEGEAKVSRDEAVAAKNLLESANMRLSARIGLQVAEYEGRLTLPDGWFQTAAQFSGAVARVDRLNLDGVPAANSGFVIDGALVHPRYAGKALLLTGAPQARVDPTPTGTPADQQTTLNSGGAASDKPSVRFPAVEQSGDKPLQATEMVWRTPIEMAGIKPFELWLLSDDLPRGARALQASDIDCSALGMGGGDSPGEPVHLAMYGVKIDPAAPEKAAVTLYVSERRDKSDPYAIRYTYATSAGATGSAVLDLTTGKVVAIHTSIGPGTDDELGIFGYGVSFRLVLDIARQKVKDAELPPVCGDV
ncbi:MAG: toll/interleukin-1 receptor domain-containing protein [Hyphomonadaceae bacterium]